MDVATSWPMRRAPGQRGGYAWRGPRDRLITRLPVDAAAELRRRARARGATVSDYVGDLLQEHLTQA